MITRKAAIIGGITLLAVVGFAYTAAADIPDSSTGELTACRTTTGGQVRVIDKEDGDSCHSYETEFSLGGPAPALKTVMVTRNFVGQVNDDIPCPSGFTAAGMGFTTNSNTLYWANNRPYNAGTPDAERVTHWSVQSEGVLSGEITNVMVTCVGYDV